jgi:hypothetical protein
MVSGVTFCRKDYTNYSQIDPEASYRTLEGLIECGQIDSEELIWQRQHKCFTGNNGLKKLTLN